MHVELECEKNKIIDAWPAPWRYNTIVSGWTLGLAGDGEDREEDYEYAVFLMPTDFAHKPRFDRGELDKWIGSLHIQNHNEGSKYTFIPGMAVSGSTPHETARLLRPLVEEFMACRERTDNIRSEYEYPNLKY